MYNNNSRFFSYDTVGVASPEKPAIPIELVLHFLLFLQEVFFMNSRKEKFVKSTFFELYKKTTFLKVVLRS